MASAVLYFQTLSVVAVFLLWGISLLNGTVKALLLAVWHGHMNENVPLRTNYTGLPLIDYPISLLVAFFFYGTNGHDEGYQLFLLDAYSTLQSAFVWLYVETARSSRKSSWINKPVVFGVLWQCLGGAVALPLYYSIHIQEIGEDLMKRARDANKARAIPFSFLLGAIVPAVVGMAPSWNGPAARSDEAHQIILAAWQPDPIWVSWTQIAGQSAASLMNRQSSQEQAAAAFTSTRISYLLAAISSTIGHLYTISRVFTSNSPGTNLLRMYVPFPFTGPAGITDILVSGPWLFLQFDLIIIGLSSISWAFYLLSNVPETKRQSKCRLIVLLFVGWLTIGPGATVSLALYVREGILPISSKAD